MPKTQIPVMGVVAFILLLAVGCVLVLSTPLFLFIGTLTFVSEPFSLELLLACGAIVIAGLLFGLSIWLWSKAKYGISLLISLVLTAVGWYFLPLWMTGLA